MNDQEILDYLNTNNNEKIQEKKDENMDDNVIYKELSQKINLLEEKIQQISEQKTKEIILPNQNQIFELKNAPLSNTEKKIEEESKEPDNNIQMEKYDEKLNKLENKKMISHL